LCARTVLLSGPHNYIDTPKNHYDREIETSEQQLTDHYCKLYYITAGNTYYCDSIHSNITTTHTIITDTHIDPREYGDCPLNRPYIPIVAIFQVVLEHVSSGT